MNKILLSAFACDPTKGSEPNNGWNWATGLAKYGFEVHCFTRFTGKDGIESKEIPSNLIFHYIKLPFGLESLYSASQISMYIYYMFWQFRLLLITKHLTKTLNFNFIHHVTWGNLKMGSFLYKLNLPMLIGPAGGGQVAPVAFKKYFGKYWVNEVRREKLNSLFLKYNPACKHTFNNAHFVLVSNLDTFNLVNLFNKNINVALTIDSALPNDFFPPNFTPKQHSNGNLNLLWVGRFMPLKGLLLILESCFY